MSSEALVQRRPIRFRVWDIESKKYRDEIPVVEQWWDSECWDDSEQALEDPYVALNVGAQFSHRLIWEQFTGLTDKNGTDIYEGDILKCNGIPMAWGVDLYETVYASVISDPATGGFKASRGIYGRTHDDSPRHFWRYEVVGNIHEHSHLLSPQ